MVDTDTDAVKPNDYKHMRNVEATDTKCTPLMHWISTEPEFSLSYLEFNQY